MPTVSNNDTEGEQKNMGKKMKTQMSDVLGNLRIYLPNEMFNSPEILPD